MLVVKNPPPMKEMGSIPGLGRSPGEGDGNPLQYSCLENPTERGAWQATICGVKKSWTRLRGLACTHAARVHTHTHTQTHTHTVPSGHSPPATTEHLYSHSQPVFQKGIYTCVLTFIFNLTAVRLPLPTALLKWSDLSHPWPPCCQSQ